MPFDVKDLRDRFTWKQEQNSLESSGAMQDTNSLALCFKLARGSR